MDSYAHCVDGPIAENLAELPPFYGYFVTDLTFYVGK